MTRSLALFFSFSLGLLCSVPACDSGGGDGEGEGETGNQPQECGTEWAEKDGMTASIMPAP